jgi:GNAT superfamily N-acetyltransferase
MDESGEVKRDWSLREYREGDEEQILELHRIAMNKSEDFQWWKWMCQDGPAGPAAIMLAETKQGLVGHHASLPVFIKIGEKITRGGHGFAVMVHPDYRHQGIFKAMGIELSKSAEARSRSISYGSPNDQSRPGFTKWLHNIDMFEIPLLVRIVDWGSVLKSRYRIPALVGNAWEHLISRTPLPRNSGVVVEPVASFDESIDKFWLKASQLKPIMVVKDMKYLNWRYVAKPGNEYRLFVAKRHGETAGYIVLKMRAGGSNRGFIVDLLALPGEETAAEALIIRAISYLKGEGAAMVFCAMMEDTPCYRLLRKLKFMRRPGEHLNVRIFDRSIPEEFVTNPGNWYYVAGDDDTI